MSMMTATISSKATEIVPTTRPVTGETFARWFTVKNECKLMTIMKCVCLANVACMAKITIYVRD